MLRSTYGASALVVPSVMAVMDVWDVGMFVLERCVLVLMRVRLPRGVGGEVRMLVVLIVHVTVVVLNRLVGV